MTLKEFYEQIDSDYKDVIKRLCDENMIKKFVFKFPEDPSFNDLKDGLKVIWALSLPGKIAPASSGAIIKDTIMNIIKELGV